MLSPCEPPAVADDCEDFDGLSVLAVDEGVETGAGVVTTGTKSGIFFGAAKTLGALGVELAGVLEAGDEIIAAPPVPPELDSDEKGSPDADEAPDGAGDAEAAAPVELSGGAALVALCFNPGVKIIT